MKNRLILGCLVLAAALGQAQTTTYGSGSGTGTFTVSWTQSRTVGPPLYTGVPTCGTGGMAFCPVSQPDTTDAAALGGLTGAGKCYVPTDFGMPVCRLVDSTWDPSLTSNTFTPIDVANHTISCNNAFVLFGSSGGLGYAAALTLSTSTPYMSLSHLYPTGPDSAHAGWFALSSSGAWSWNCGSTPNLLYLKHSDSSTQVDTYDFTGYASSPSGSPASATFYNFAAGSTGSWGTTSANCLISTAAPVWNELWGPNKSPADAAVSFATSLVQQINAGIDTISVTNGSTAFTIAGPTPLRTDGTNTDALITINGVANTYAIATVAAGGMSGTLTTTYSGTTGSGISMSIPGAQGSGMDVVVYKPGIGCYHLNIGTGTVTADAGTTGAVTGTTDRAYIHGHRLTPDGNHVFISAAVCVPGTCVAPSPMGYLWTIGTTSVVSLCASPNQCSGHNVDGFSDEVNQGGIFPQSQIRTLSSLPSFTNIMPNPPIPLSPACPGQLDTHLAWQDVDAADSYPFILTSEGIGTGVENPGSYVCGLIDEVDLVNPATGQIWRAAHTLGTGANWNYSSQNEIGQMSGDGLYFMFGSDWSNTIGVGTLGQYGLGAGACVNSPAGPTACRSDIFMVRLYF
jgi:hypothetical protein